MKPDVGTSILKHVSENQERPHFCFNIPQDPSRVLCGYSVFDYIRLTFTFVTFDCLAASNWQPGHPRSDHHVSNPHRPDYY